MDLEQLKITEQTVKAFSGALNNYVINERPFEHNYSNKTYMEDILYLLGTSIDGERFLGANGYDDFKEIIKAAIAS